MKRIISFVLCLSMLLAFLLYLPSDTFAAKEGEQTVYEELQVMDPKLWSAEGGTVSRPDGEEQTAGLLFTFDGSENADETVYSTVSLRGRFKDLALSSFNELAFDLAVSTDSPDKITEYTITLGTKDATVQYTRTAETARAKLYIPLDEEIKDALYSIRIDAHSANGSITMVTIYSIIADTAHSYALIDKFYSHTVFSENLLNVGENEITVVPENKSLSITFTFDDTFTKSDDVLSWIDFTGADSGNISATVEDKDGTPATITPQIINKSGKYSFLSSGGFETFTVHFENLPSDDAVTVTAAGIFKLWEDQPSAGTITSCIWDTKNLIISGTISDDASVKYSGSRLLVYAIPVSDARTADINDYSPAHSQSFSSKFKISFTPEKDHCEYFYKVVLDTKDGLIPVGDLTAPASGTLAPVASSASSAIHGADASDVFEANISNTILDVALGSLTEEKYTYPAIRYTYSGKDYYFNTNVLDVLDDSIGFFTSSGTGVYLRLFSDDQCLEFDYSVSAPDTLAVLLASVSFLAERYPNLNGFIMGKAVNEGDGGITPEAMHDTAALICAFTEAVKSTIDDGRAVVPYAKSAENDPFLAASMINYYLSHYNCGAVVSMYQTADEEQLFASSTSRLSAIALLFYAQSDGCSVFWNAPASYTEAQLTESYRALCVSGAAAGMHFTAVSVAQTTKSAALYSSIKEMLNNENVIRTKNFSYTAIVEDRTFKGTYGLWDFTTVYDTFGWVSGGSFTSPFTASGEKGERVLRAESAGSLSGAGILICRAQPALDLSGLYSKVTLTVSSKEAATAQIVVIFSSGESRAEFFATVNCNEKTSLICDLSSFEGAKKVDYAAVVVRGGADAAAELSKIELCSDTVESEALRERFAAAVVPVHNPLLYAAIILLAAVTVTVFAALVKKQKKMKAKNQEGGGNDE